MDNEVSFMLPDDPKPAYFGDCESCGDGTSRAYLGRTIGDITNAIADWIANGHQPESITITMAMYDDASVDALPEM
jgi:hypothetical protein